MSKRTVGAVVVVIAALLYLIAGAGWRADDRAAVAAAASPADERGVAAAEQSSASAQPVPASAAQAANTPVPPAKGASDAALSADEREALVMYDEMQSAFAQYRSDCLRMGEAVAIAVQAHTPAITRLRDLRDSLSPEAQAAALQRLEAAQGPHLQELREGVEQAVARCKHDPQLLNALRELARLNAPRGAQPTQ